MPGSFENPTLKNEGEEPLEGVDNIEEKTPEETSEETTEIPSEEKQEAIPLEDIEQEVPEEDQGEEREETKKIEEKLENLVGPERLGEIKEKAGSWRALNIIYNCRFAKGNKAIDNYWLGIINAQAVRNRFKLVKRELKKIITELADKGEEIKLLSIASGSAQTVFEAFKEIIEERNRSLIFKIILLDIDDTALEYARRLAKEHGIEQNVEFINRSTTDLEKASNGIRPNLIEMVGFLDYRPHEKAARLIRRIYNLLPPGGKFITANICPNREQYFMKWVIDWPMIYREPQELRKLVAECGFEKCKIICEPQKVHAVAICQKPC